MSRSDFALIHPLRVRWAEVDPQGVVFNGHYLAYFDVAVTEYYRAIGHPYPEGLAGAGGDLFARKAEIEFLSPARYDEVIDLCARVARLGRSSLRFELELHRGDTRLVTGAITYVFAGTTSGKAEPLPAFLREAIRAFERVPPEEA